MFAFQLKPQLKFIRCMLLIAVPVQLGAQSPKQTTQELSKAARKGLLEYSRIDQEGQLRFTYKMKVDKKSDQVNYEDYVFSKDLGFKGIQPSSENKEVHPDQKVTSMYAFVGGSNSFNVLSMTLNLQREEWERIWDYKKQTYKWGKRLSKEVVKPRNNDSKYKGLASFQNDGDGSVLVIATYEDQKEDETQFVMLHVGTDLELKETKFPVKGNYSMVYCGALNSGNIYAILAPNKGMPNTRAYVYTEFSNAGILQTSQEFTAPSPNTLIMDSREEAGSLFFVAGSGKNDDAYNEVFSHYAPIYNPGYSTSNNKWMDKYERKVYDYEFKQLHLLKFTNGKLAFSGSSPISSFEQKLVLPPGQKKAHAYEGKKLFLENLFITAAGEYLVTGQLEDKKIINGGKDVSWRYYDFVCLHFNSEGQLKAQYAVEKMNDDSKSEQFSSKQHFIPSKDGQSVYWEILEVKGTKGYNSLMDAFNGDATITANYFPRIAKINLNTTQLGAFTVLGENGTYFLYRYHSWLMDEASRTRYYIGHDEDYEKIYVGSYQFE